MNFRILAFCREIGLRLDVYPEIFPGAFDPLPKNREIDSFEALTAKAVERGRKELGEEVSRMLCVPLGAQMEQLFPGTHRVQIVIDGSEWGRVGEDEFTFGTAQRPSLSDMATHKESVVPAVQSMPGDEIASAIRPLIRESILKALAKRDTKNGYAPGEN